MPCCRRTSARFSNANIKPAPKDEPARLIPWHRRPDTEFQASIRGEVQSILDRRGNLHDALRAKAAFVFKGQGGDLVQTLCGAEPETAIDDVLRPATEQCLAALDGNSAEFSATWEAAKSVLGWLSVFSVSLDWVEQQEKNGVVSGLSFLR